VVRSGYALYAEDFARRLSAITGTRSEATQLSKATGVLVADASSPSFGQYVAVTIVDRDGYKKAAGTYNIRFAISASRTVDKTIRASISNDTPRAPVTNVTNPRAPAVVVNTPAPAAAPAAEPPIVNIEQPPVPESPVVEEPEVIEPVEPPLSSPEPAGEWHIFDLLLTIAIMALGLYLMAFALRRKEAYEYADSNRGRLIRMWGQLGVLLGIGAVVALLVTQDFTGTMRLIDIWTILFAALLGTEILAVTGVTSEKNMAWEDEREL
jgi:hypothetical protein